MPRKKAKKEEQQRVSAFKELFDRIECDTGLVFVDTPEETRLVREVYKEYNDQSVQFWSMRFGLHIIDDKITETPDEFMPHEYNPSQARTNKAGDVNSRAGLLDVLSIIEEDCREKLDPDKPPAHKTIYILRDADKYFQNPIVLRAVRDIIYMASCASSVIIMTGFGITVPNDLAKDTSYLKIGYPTKQEILEDIIPLVKQQITEHNKKNTKKEVQIDPEFDEEEVARACTGLTEDQILNVLQYTSTVDNKICTDRILEEKKAIINKSDILEYWICDTSLNDVGGFGAMKQWINVRKVVMTSPYAAKFKAKYPKGIMLVGVQGSGKATSVNSKVLLADKSWKRIGDIEINDIVATPNGKTAKVTGIFEHPQKERIVLEFKDGRQSSCCEDHLWKIYNKNFKCYSNKDGWKVVDTKELMRLMEQKADTRRFYIPLMTDSEIGEELPIHPYILGILLGDGHISNGFVSFTTKDIDVVNKVQSCLTAGYKLSEHKSDTKCTTYNIIGEDTVNYYKKHLSLLGLYGKLSNEKLIPEICYRLSLSDKKELIQGLMDSDGSTDGNLSYSTVSFGLAVGIQNLIRSIGGQAWIAYRDTCYTYNGEKKQGQSSYRINIRYRNPKELVYLKRKKDKLSDDYQYNDLKLEILNVERTGIKEDMRCIMLDDNDHLYITDDYIVTHNTFIAKSIAASLGMGLIKLEMGKVFAGLVGESLAPWEELVLYHPTGEAERVTFEQAYEWRDFITGANIGVQSYDRDGKAIFLPVQDVIKHKRTKELVRVTTKSGRSVDVTIDHSLFTISDEGKLIEMAPSDMKEGTVIAVPSNYAKTNSITAIDLRKEIIGHADEDKWMVENPLDYLGDKVYEYTSPKSKAQYENGRPLNLSLIPIEELHNLEGAKIRAKNTETNHAILFNITEDIAELMGWYTAEGSTTADRLRLHVHKNEVKLVEGLIRECGYNSYSYQDKDSDGSTIFFGDTGLKRIFDYINITNKDRISEVILSLNESSRKAYIKGLFSGDGGTSGKHLELSQSRKSIIKDILGLLASVGIFATSYPRLDGGYRISIHSSVYKKKYLDEVGFSQVIKQTTAESILGDNDWGHKVPFFKSLKDKASSHDVDKSSEWISYKNAVKLDPKLADVDIYWDTVKSVEVIEDQPEFVYDISVPGNENFIAGNIICHNSEKRMRQALAQIEAAGGVVIVDEIDKGLSGAGSSDKTDGGTTSRVIGTLLTWLQEEHPGVFLIATANDISNLLNNHPELLRKGRFDEIWFSDLPTEEERKEIFNIHLKKVDRNPDNFDITELAKVSYYDEDTGKDFGYTGAEIEYAVSDAIQEAFALGGGKELEIGSKEDITTRLLTEKLSMIKPMSKIGHEPINKMRKWAIENARNVSAVVNTESNKPKGTKKNRVNLRGKSRPKIEDCDI